MDILPISSSELSSSYASLERTSLSYGMTQKQKILGIVILAFGCLAFLYHQFSNRNKPITPLSLPPLTQVDFFERHLTKLLPVGKRLGEAVDNGDCFFDAAAQTLSKALGQQMSIKDVRMRVHHYLQELHKRDPEDNWVKKACIKNVDADYETLLDRIQLTAEESGTSPIWGSAFLIRIITEIYQVQCTLYNVGTYEADILALMTLREQGRGDEIYNESRREVLFTEDPRKWGNTGPIIEIACYQRAFNGHFLPVHDQELCRLSFFQWCLSLIR